jgi:hypothetical protein
LGEDGDNAGFFVAVLAGAVNIGIAKRNPRQAESLAIELEILFASSFGDAVKRRGSPDWLIFNDRKTIGVGFSVVSAAGVGIDDFFNLVGFAGFEEVDHAGNIDIQIFEGVGHGVGNFVLGGQMKNGFRLKFSKDRI